MDLLIVPLNVAELIDDMELHPGLLGLRAAIDEIPVGYGLRGGYEGLDAWDAVIDALVARYTNEYRRYTTRFTIAAEAAAKERGLTVGVEVVTDPDPASTWRSGSTVVNPDGFDMDQLILEIWTAAHDAVALPHVEIRFVPPSDPTAEGGRR